MDSIGGFAQSLDAIASLPKKLTVRVVFDEFVNPDTYSSAVTQLYDKAYVMGELLDSFYVKQYTVDAYIKRASDYVNALGGKIDIWEVGNEVNGEWLGTTADVVNKISGAYDVIKAKGGTTELTLYYNEDCWANPANEMFTWSQTNIPARMKTGLDYVLVSYYEDDCNGLKPNWQAVFDRLGTIFPNSKIGIGEMGTTRANAKQDFMNRYYSMKISHPRYVGGQFYWYFHQDMVPKTTTLWSYFRDLLLTL